MKYINNITWALILCMGLVVSCKDDDEPGTSEALTLDKTEITMGPEGGTERVQVTSNLSWVSSVSGPWVSVSPANGIGSAECILSVDSTLENTSRTLEIKYAPQGQQPQTLTVTQFGFGKQILIKDPEVELESSANYDDRYFDVTISTNVELKIDMDNIDYSFAEGEPSAEDEEEANSQKTGWIELEGSNTPVVDLDRKARPRTVKVRFRWDMNTIAYTRVAKVSLVPLHPEEDQLVDNDGNPIEKVTLTVTQKAAPKITDDRAGDSLAIIMICEKIQSMVSYDPSENMRNWDGVTLWERTDDFPEGMDKEAAIGRVRSVNFMGFDIKEGEDFPREIRYLKYLEGLYIQSNTNRQSREMHFGEDICDLKYLKNLNITSYGLVDLPENIQNLKSLESLVLSSNNFASLADLTAVINKDNFPNLKMLELSGCRRSDAFIDLSATSDNTYNGVPLGLCINIGKVGTVNPERQALIDLLSWDNLTSFGLSYGYIEGELPSDEEMVAALGAKAHYSESDFFEGGAAATDWEYKISKDTCQWLLSDDRPITNALSSNVRGTDVPRVLPFARVFSINLNFLTGPMPNWIMFHPYFVEWNPGSMVLNQQEKGKNSDGVIVGFDNISPYDFNYSYYYGNDRPDMSDPSTYENVAYPLYYFRYVALDEDASE